MVDFATILTKEHWKKIGVRNHHGIALPLGALRDPTNAGIGEFLNLIPLIEWCSSIGFDVIQLLPLNDSGALSSPYSALSSMALSPVYITIGALDNLGDDLKKEFIKLQLLNTQQRYDYPLVYKKKIAFLKKYFERVFHEVRRTKKYEAFVTKNGWLRDYAIFKVLKSQFSDQAWYEWPQEFQDMSEIEKTHFYKEHNHSCAFFIFLQFLAFSQWEEVRHAAKKEAVFLKGDLPILINKDSTDVWSHKKYFSMDFSAGAPPDMYNEEGQNWGFPLYDWQVLEDHEYDWWKNRLSLASELYDLYRIDHIVGFFRIWAIPEQHTAKEGFFLPCDEKKWLPQGEKILNMMVQHAPILPIGEDLGTVPQSVRQTMHQLGIAGTKVLRWERYWNGDGSFIDPKTYDLLSMSTVSTHDSETLTQWWERQRDERRRFVAQRGLQDEETLSFKNRVYILSESHTSNSIFHINLLQEYLALVPEFSWEDPNDDRINIPGTINDTNWTYRYKKNIQEITQCEPLRKLMTTFSITHNP